MTVYQNALRYVFYPLAMTISKWTGLGQKAITQAEKKPPVTSFYDLSAVAISGGQIVDFNNYRGRTLLIVNVASNCGYTGQYAELEALYRGRQDSLVILGFPSNDFGNQEPGTDGQIAAFCSVNFWVQFPLLKKGVVKGSDKQPVYDWLTDPAKNGWNSQEPTWNFCKYVISPEGHLIGFFSAAVSPLSEQIREMIEGSGK